MTKWTPRLIASLVATAITLGIGWAFVYEYSLRLLMAGGLDKLGKLLASINLGSTAWWRDFLAVAFDVLVVLVAIVGTWWVLGHFALEASEVGKWRRHKEEVYVERFTVWQRVQHIWMIITFVICAFTGLGLQARMFSSRADAITLHVISGLTMGVLVIIHFFQYLTEAALAKAKGESLRERFPMLDFYSMRFLRGFVKDLLRSVSSKVKPEKYGKYDPEQLFEYWGIYWGMAVLGIPGLLMFLYGRGFMDGLLYVMHTKEAVLAVSFLIMVHMAYTHFRPKVFPMDTTFITGKVPLKRAEEEHPLWAEKLKEGG